MTKRILGKPFSFKKRLRLYWRDAFTCRYCSRTMHPLSDDLTLDHIDPQGGDDDDNLATSCRSCNSRKGNKPYIPEPITTERMLKALGKGRTAEKPSLYDVKQIMEVVAQHWQVTPAQMISMSRQNLLVRARADLAHRLRREGLSLMEIARILGRSDHSTVVHLLKTYPHKEWINGE